MKNIQQEMLQLVAYLKNRPLMVLNGDIHSLSTYMLFYEGLFYSLRTFNKLDIEREIAYWYQTLVDSEASNLHWFGHFELINKNKTDSEKISIFLDTIEQFFLSRTSSNPWPVPSQDDKRKQ